MNLTFNVWGPNSTALGGPIGCLEHSGSFWGLPSIRLGSTVGAQCEDVQTQIIAPSVGGFGVATLALWWKSGSSKYL